MKFFFPMIASVIAFALLSACSSKPAVSEEQGASVAPQMPDPSVTEPSAAVPPEPAATTPQKVKSKKTSSKKKKKNKK